jgi:hypothetical protein
MLARMRARRERNIGTAIRTFRRGPPDKTARSEHILRASSRAACSGRHAMRRFALDCGELTEELRMLATCKACGGDDAGGGSDSPVVGAPSRLDSPVPFTTLGALRLTCPWACRRGASRRARRGSVARNFTARARATRCAAAPAPADTRALQRSFTANASRYCRPTAAEPRSDASGR